MNVFDFIPIGYDPPIDVNVVVEIPKGSNIKYELEKEIGVLRIDRVLFPSMIYPGNYGFIPQTLSGDGDAEDVLILGELSIVPIAVVNTHPIGILITEDEKGEDSKIITVPSTMVDPTTSGVNDIEEIDPDLRSRIEHFFLHHKDLEKGKFVKIIGWKNRAHSYDIIIESMKRYKFKH
ncbi:MAG: inorganic diphosphatase [Candidatus Eiseniibacteriota bacterium]